MVSVIRHLDDVPHFGYHQLPCVRTRLTAATSDLAGPVLRSTVRINIIKQPAGVVGGFSLDHYRPGRVYDVAAHLANYLVAEGFALFERRRDEIRRVAPALERRKK